MVDIRTTIASILSEYGGVERSISENHVYWTLKTRLIPEVAALDLTEKAVALPVAKIKEPVSTDVLADIPVIGFSFDDLTK